MRQLLRLVVAPRSLFGGVQRHWHEHGRRAVFGYPAIVRRKRVRDQLRQRPRQGRIPFVLQLVYCVSEWPRKHPRTNKRLYLLDTVQPVSYTHLTLPTNREV